MGVKVASAVATAAITLAGVAACSGNPARRVTPTSGPIHLTSPVPTATPEPRTDDVTLAYFRHGIGVVGVSHGCCGSQGSAPSQLWLTTDMRHWRNVTPPGSANGQFTSDAPTFQDAWFTDAHTGWVTTWDTGNLKIKIFGTNDAGATWSKVSGGKLSVHGGAEALVQPITATLAYKTTFDPAAPAMDLSVSHDAGRHWTSVYDGPPPRTHAHQPLAGPFEMPTVFTRESRGFGADADLSSLPSDTFYPNPGYLFTTGDGGRTWTRQNPPLPATPRACPRAGDYRAKITCLDGLPTFTTSATGIAPVVIRERRLGVVGMEVTDDGGRSWHLTNTLNVPMPVARLTPTGSDVPAIPFISIASSRSWWVVTSPDGQVIARRTADAGRTWHRTVAPVPGRIDQLSAVSDREAWMTVDAPIGNSNDETVTELMRTTDGGRSWRRVVPRATATSVTPEGVSFWTSQRGLLVSTTATESCWLSGHPCSAGRIEVTSDGGHTWRTSLTTPDSPFDVSATGSDIAWVAEGRCDIGDSCDANRLVRTTDGGRTWTATEALMPLRSISAVSATDAWAIHDRMLSPARMDLVHTTDGGRSWQAAGYPCVATTGPEPWLSSVSFASDSLGWVTCMGQPEQTLQSKTVLETTDGAKTWTVLAQSCPHLATGRTHPTGGGSLSCDGTDPGLALRADGFGWLWGSRGGLNATTTSGRSWTPIARQVVRRDETTGIAASLVSDRSGELLVRGPYGNRLEVTHDAGRHWTILKSWPLAPWLTR